MGQGTRRPDFGGVIFSTWRLLSSSTLPGKFETEGKKKIGERQVWVLSYTPKGGLPGGSYIELYFDAENFQHLRTVYRQKEAVNVFGGTSNTLGAAKDTLNGWNSGIANNYFTLTEAFGDIRGDIGLTLPHRYSITLVLDGHTGTTEFTWNCAIGNTV